MKTNKRNVVRLNESQLKQMIAESVKRILKENENPDEDVYAVFFKYGDKANNGYLSEKEAFEYAESIEDDGYDVIVAKFISKGWYTVYETEEYCWE